MDNGFMLEGLEAFFDALDVDWRMVYWPEHLNDGVMKDIHIKNIGKSFDYGRFTERYKDVAWKGFDVFGNPIIHEDEVDEDSWRVLNEYHSHPDYKKEYMDYHEIRVLNEKWNPTSTEERIRIISEWVNGCDFILVDLSGCLQAEQERALDTVQGLVKTLKREKTYYFIFDFIPAYEFMGIKRRRAWDDEIGKLKKTTRMYIENPEQIKELEKTMGDKLSLSILLEILQEAHNKKIKAILAKEIRERQKG